MKQEIPSYFKDFDNYILEKSKDLDEYEIFLLKIDIIVDFIKRLYRTLYSDKEKS